MAVIGRVGVGGCKKKKLGHLCRIHISVKVSGQGGTPAVMQGGDAQNVRFNGFFISGLGGRSFNWVGVGQWWWGGRSRPSVHVAVQAEYQFMNSIHLGFSSFFFLVNTCRKQLVGSRGSEKGQNGLTQREDGASELLGR